MLYYSNITELWCSFDLFYESNYTIVNGKNKIILNLFPKIVWAVLLFFIAFVKGNIFILGEIYASAM